MNSPIDELLRIANSIARGEVPAYQHNEDFTAGAFDLLLVNAGAAEAYEWLADLCQRFESLDSTETGMQGYYALATLLARQSATTEMPPGMQAVILAHPDLSTDLRSWYRCSS